MPKIKLIEDITGSIDKTKETLNKSLVEVEKDNTGFYVSQIEISSDDYVNDFLEYSIPLDFGDFSDDSNSLENGLNTKRETYLRDILTPDFMQILKDEDFEFGYVSRSEDLVREQLKINTLATKNWLSEMFISSFSDEKILIGILRLLGRFEEDIISPQGQTMAIAALNHNSPEIKELGIRAFESWQSKSSLGILASLDIKESWLKNYLDQVISDLRQVYQC
jgi:hypothetical protein